MYINEYETLKNKIYFHMKSRKHIKGIKSNLIGEK